jgi:hypothetical protein
MTPSVVLRLLAPTAMAAALLAPARAGASPLVTFSREGAFIIDGNGTLTIQQDGRATLRKLGRITFRLSRAQLKNLRAKVAAADLEKAQPSYGRILPDAGTDTIRAGGHVVKLEASHDDAPRAIKRLDGVLLNYFGKTTDPMRPGF